ncbi:MAG TPA: MGMT family protein [Patescibacteria group bacterium]|nr:MGMT family protein [Patescibacteria group bacterium]
MNHFKTRVFHLVATIPKGKVTTYGAIAHALQIKSPRAVGRALHANRDPYKTPCHRVVFSNGTLATNYAFGGSMRQKMRLEKEGVRFLTKNRVYVKKSLHVFPQ